MQSERDLKSFFIEYVRQSDNPGSAGVSGNAYTQERFEEFTELLEKNVSNHKLVIYYTNTMNLSSYQLSEKTKTTVGKTASAMISCLKLKDTY